MTQTIYAHVNKRMKKIIPVAYACSPSTSDAKAGSLEPRSPDQPGQHSETLSPSSKKETVLTKALLVNRGKKSFKQLKVVCCKSTRGNLMFGPSCTDNELSHSTKEKESESDLEKVSLTNFKQEQGENKHKNR
jgi:hypothetical protein